MSRPERPTEPRPPTTSAAGHVLRPRPEEHPPSSAPPTAPPSPVSPPSTTAVGHLPPPPPRSASPALPIPGPRLRRIASIVAASAVGLLAVIWLQTFLPAPPITSTTTPIALLPVVIAVVFVALLVANSRQQRTRRSRKQGLPLTGWRRRAYALACVLPLVTVVSTIFTGPDGTPEHHGDRYYLDSADGLVEVSENTWRQAEATTLRFFACVVLLFAAWSALILAEPDGAPGELPPAPRQANHGADGRLDRRSRLYGHRAVDQEVALPPDEVLRRLRIAMPTLDASPVGTTIVGAAEWEEPQPWPQSKQSLWVHVDVRIAPVSASVTTVGLRLRLANRADARRALSFPVFFLSMAVVGLTAFVLAAAWRAGPGAVVVVLWIGIMVFNSYTIGSSPSRTTATVERRLLAATTV